MYAGNAEVNLENNLQKYDQCLTDKKLSLKMKKCSSEGLQNIVDNKNNIKID